MQKTNKKEMITWLFSINQQFECPMVSFRKMHLPIIDNFMAQNFLKDCLVNKHILLNMCESQTGSISARGLVSTARQAEGRCTQPWSRASLVNKRFIIYHAPSKNISEKQKGQKEHETDRQPISYFCLKRIF